MHRTTSVKIIVLSALATLAFAGNGEVEKDETKNYDSPTYRDPVYTFYQDPIYVKPIYQEFYGSPPPMYMPPPRYPTPPKALPPVYTPPPKKPQPVLPRVAPPPKDAIVLCANAQCAVGTVCRVLQLCATCRPVPACVNQQTIPPGTDQACRKFNFRQAVLLGKAPVQVKPLNCIPWMPNLPRGGCNPGTVCVTVAQPGAPWGTGTCCAGKVPPGTLPPAPLVPAPRPSPAILPAPQPYPSQAQPPVQTPVVTPPVNPLPVPNLAVIASPAATVAAPVVQPPTYGQKPGVCQSSSGPCTGIVCSTDYDCDHYMKCCPSACGGRRCSDPPAGTVPYSKPVQPARPFW